MIVVAVHAAGLRLLYTSYLIVSLDFFYTAVYFAVRLCGTAVGGGSGAVSLVFTYLY